MLHTTGPLEMSLKWKVLDFLGGVISYPLTCECLTNMDRVVAISCSPGPISIMLSMPWTNWCLVERKGDQGPYKWNYGIGLACSYTSEVRQWICIAGLASCKQRASDDSEKKAFARSIAVYHALGDVNFLMQNNHNWNNNWNWNQHLIKLPIIHCQSPGSIFCVGQNDKLNGMWWESIGLSYHNNPHIGKETNVRMLPVAENCPSKLCIWNREITARWVRAHWAHCEMVLRQNSIDRLTSLSPCSCC